MNTVIIRQNIQQDYQAKAADLSIQLSNLHSSDVDGRVIDRELNFSTISLLRQSETKI